MKGGEFLIVGVPGIELDAATRDILREIQPGGFILFGRNIKTPGQLRHLTDDLRSVVDHEPVIAVDQEGGRVSRLKECGTEPPSARQLREKADPVLVERHGELTGRLLRLFGFNLDLAPVLDVSFDDEADNSLKNRTYGRSPDEVSRNAGAFIAGLARSGVLNCGKHFPGYAAAAVDPHHELPEIPRTRAELESCEWLPFVGLLPRLDSVMIGHIRNRHLDPDGTASSLSRRIITGIIRDAWKYEGCVISDDLDMGAIIHEYGVEESVRKAMEAGNDMLLLCHRLEVAHQAARVLGGLSETVAAPARARSRALRRRLVAPESFSEAKHRALDRMVYDLRVAVLGEAEAAKRSPDDGKRSPVEIF